MKEKIIKHQQEQLKVDWDELRIKYYDECTEGRFSLRKVNLTPHNLFEWFKLQLQRKIGNTDNSKQPEEDKSIIDIVNEAAERAGGTAKIIQEDEVREWCKCDIPKKYAKDNSICKKCKLKIHHLT